MLPTILFFLVIRYRSSRGLTNPLWMHRVQNFLLRTGYIAALTMAFVILLPRSARAQEIKLHYTIVRNGDAIGKLALTQTSCGNLTSIKVESEIKFSLLFSFTAMAREDCVFQNGIMTHSSIYRKVNGKEKANRKTVVENAAYHITGDDQDDRLSYFPIRCCLLSLYCLEPQHISSVYSDNLRQMLALQKINENTYKVSMPGGNYNNYTYQNGICTRIEMHQRLYQVQFVLNR